MDENELLPKVTRKLEQLEALTDLGKAMISSLDSNDVLTQIMNKISLLLRPSDWSLLLYDADRQDLYFEIAVGQSAKGLHGMRLPIGEGIAGWVAREKRPLLVPDVSKDERFSARFDQITNFKTHGILAVPLLYRGQTMGVIELVSTSEGYTFDDEQLDLLSPFADFAAIAIANARQYAQIERLTFSDDCTGLYNARFLHEALNREFKRCQRYSKTFSLLFMDLDFFKNINDTHGHLEGTKMLSEMASLITRTMREVDIAARYGGDEFVVILPETTREGCQSAAIRLCNAIHSKNFLKGLDLRMTASIGGATYPDDAKDALTLLSCADKAMYFIKENGRDGVALSNLGRVA